MDGKREEESGERTEGDAAGRGGRALARFRQAVESSGHAIYMTTPDGTIEYVNPAFEDITGYTRKEALGENPRLLKSGEHDEAYYEALWTTVLSGDVWQEEIVNERKDGDRYTAFQTIAPVTDTDGAIEQFVAIQSDITVQKERERDLRSFKKAVESSGHSIVITDTDGTIEYVNPAFEEITGYGRKDVLGKTPRILRSGEHDHEFYADLWSTILSGNVWENELVNERSDGERFVVNQTIAPVTDTDGEIERFVAVNHDITELKEHERDLEDQRDALETLNQVVRHDIRNDLQVIRGRGELLREHVDEAGAVHVAELLTAANEAIEITRTARDLADTVLRTDDELSSVSLRPCLTEQVEQVQDTYDDAVLSIDGSLPAVDVRADELLESVFDNLLRNAVIHNDTDTPTIHVTVERTGEGTARIAIADNGPGVPERERETIFGKGEKGLDSPGTGLGLYLVRTLVERYGGDVWVEDNEPRGSVFVVELRKADHGRTDSNGAQVETGTTDSA